MLPSDCVVACSCGWSARRIAASATLKISYHSRTSAVTRTYIGTSIWVCTAVSYKISGIGLHLLYGAWPRLIYPTTYQPTNLPTFKLIYLYMHVYKQLRQLGCSSIYIVYVERLSTLVSNIVCSPLDNSTMLPLSKLMMIKNVACS